MEVPGAAAGKLKANYALCADFVAPSVVAIQMPAQTATRPTTRLSVNGSLQEQRGQQPGDQRVDRHGVGDAGRAGALQGKHPEEEGQRAAAGGKIERGDAFAGAEAGDLRQPPESTLTTTSTAPPTAIPMVRKPSALERSMKGREYRRCRAPCTGSRRP